MAEEFLRAFGQLAERVSFLEPESTHRLRDIADALEHDACGDTTARAWEIVMSVLDEQCHSESWKLRQGENEHPIATKERNLPH